MITTNIIPTTLYSKLSAIKGFSTRNFKMATILFIVLLNTLSLSAQYPVLTCSNSRIIPSGRKNIKSISEGFAFKIYTVFIAKSFPLIEGSASKLTTIEEGEQANFDLLKNLPLDKKLRISITETEESQLKSTHKNKIAPKLNS